MSFNIVNRSTVSLSYQMIDQAYGNKGPSTPIPPGNSIPYLGENIPISSKMIITYPPGFPPVINGPTSAPNGNNLYITGGVLPTKENTYTSSLTTSLTDPQLSVAINNSSLISYGQTPEQAKKQIEDANAAAAKLSQEQIEYARNFVAPTQAPIPTQAPSSGGEPTPDPAPENSNTMLYVIIGIILLLIIVGVVFFMLKKKKTNPATSFGNRLKKTCKRF